MAQRTRYQGQFKGPERRPPDSPELELELLGAALWHWEGLGLERLDPKLFYTPAHRRVAEAINKARELGHVNRATVSAWVPADAATVAEASAVAALPKSALKALEDLATLAATRQRFAEAARTYREAGVLVPLEEAPPVADSRDAGNGWHGFSVKDAWMDGQAHYLLTAGADSYETTAAELRDGSTWDHLPAVAGTGTPQERHGLNELVRRQGAPIMRRPDTLPGYCAVAEAATAEAWGQICDELARSPRLAFFVGAALASYFLAECGREYEVRPLGFVVHALGRPRCGKTTAQLVAAAVVGNPGLAPDGLLHSWGGTRKGLEVLAAEVGRYPLVRSDTSTWEGSRAELALACMQLFEGPRDNSTRRGERASVGRAYQGILLSSGNEPICSAVSKDRGAILSRVLELEGPFTLDAGQAHRLSRLATENFGWPITRVCNGYFTAERFTSFADAAAALLVAEENGTVMDAARRCAVVVAGAATLGALVDDDRLEAMADAAMAGAVELLERLRANVDEGHPPIGRALVEAVWDAVERRAARFPVLHNGAVADQGPPWPAELDGFLCFDEGQKLAKVFVPAAEEIAAGAGIADVGTAAREARDLGLLVAPAGKLRSLVVRRDGDGGYRRLRVYVFRELPDDDVTVDRAPPDDEKPADRAPPNPLPRAPEGARGCETPASGYANENVPRAPRAPKKSRDVLKSNEYGARPSAYSRAVTDGQRLWHEGGQEPAPDSFEALLDRVGELAGETKPVLWLSPAGRARYRLPAKIREAAKIYEQRGDHVLRAGPRGVLVHCTEYGDDFGELEGEALWRALATFRELVGIEYVFSPGNTVAGAIRLAHRRHRFGPAVPEPAVDISGTAWAVAAHAWTARETPPESGLVAYDGNAAYLAAWKGCDLPGDDWEELAPHQAGARQTPGYYLLELGALEAELERRDLPPVFDRKGHSGPARWVTEPLCRLAAELAQDFNMPPVACQWAFTASGHRYLDTVALRLAAAYNTLKQEQTAEAAAALAAVKGMYPEGTALFEFLWRNDQGGQDLRRRAWTYTITDRFAANTFRAARAAGAVGWSNIDHLTFLAEPSPPPGLRTGTAPGTWKREQ